MNAPKQIAAAFRALDTAAPTDAAWTADQMDAAADQYQRDQIASAKSQPEAGYDVEDTK